MGIDLEAYNPWWSKPSALDDHPLIRAWSGSRIRHDPGPRLAFQHDDLVYSLRGPRRVGKTTFLMREVQNLLRAMPPQNIFYYSFEVENDPIDIVNAVRTYLAKFNDVHGRRFLLLDEISNVKDWQKAIKKLWDMRYLEECTVLVTGSNSVDIRGPAETMPGRRGVPGPDDPLDKVLAPASFGEYIGLIDPSIKKTLDTLSLSNPLEKVRVFLRLCNGNVDERLHRLFAHQNGLESHLKYYLLSGGMPYVANELLSTQTIKPATYAQCLSSIKADLSLAGQNVNRIFRILPNIINSLGTPVSWSSLRKATDVSSHYMVENSIMALNDSFITFMLYKYDSTRKSPKYDAPKKLYFSDPYFLHALGGGSSDKLFISSRHRTESQQLLPALIEQAVAEHATRLAFAMSKNKLMFERTESVFYWQSRRGREVDVVFPIQDGLAAIEVKYQGQIRGDDLQGIYDLRRATGSQGGIVVTRDTLGTRSGVALVPAFIFLLLA